MGRFLTDLGIGLEPHERVFISFPFPSLALVGQRTFQGLSCESPFGAPGRLWKWKRNAIELPRVALQQSFHDPLLLTAIGRGPFSTHSLNQRRTDP